MKRNHLYSFLYLVLWPVIHLLFFLTQRGRNRIPQGGAVFCCNHTSNWDPIIVMIAAGFGCQLHALAKVEISRWPVVGGIVKNAGTVFVDRGKADIASIKASMKYLKDGQKILIFPEGTRVTEEDATAARGGVAMLAVRTGVPVVPVYLDDNKKLFHRTFVIFGEPYMPEVGSRKATAEEYQQIAEESMRRVYELKGERK